jgi:hypothetical protein
VSPTTALEVTVRLWQNKEHLYAVVGNDKAGAEASKDTKKHIEEVWEELRSKDCTSPAASFRPLPPILKENGPTGIGPLGGMLPMRGSAVANAHQCIQGSEHIEDWGEIGHAVKGHFFSEEEVRFHLGWGIKPRCNAKTAKVDAQTKSGCAEKTRHVIFSIVILGPIDELIRATHDARALDSLVIRAYEFVSYSNKIDPVAVSGFFRSARLQDVREVMEPTVKEKRA